MDLAIDVLERDFGKEQGRSSGASNITGTISIYIRIKTRILN